MNVKITVSQVVMVNTIQMAKAGCAKDERDRNPDPLSSHNKKFSISQEQARTQFLRLESAASPRQDPWRHWSEKGHKTINKKARFKYAEKNYRK